MKSFEYKITKHPNDEFSHLVYFCNMEGECKLDEIPSDQTRVLTDMLNRNGSEGWELVQVLFGKDGIVVFWKRRI